MNPQYNNKTKKERERERERCCQPGTQGDCKVTIERMA
jgi:hypothetical protein